MYTLAELAAVAGAEVGMVVVVGKDAHVTAVILDVMSVGMGAVGFGCGAVLAMRP